MSEEAAALPAFPGSLARADDIGPRSGNSSSGFPDEAAAEEAATATAGETGGIAGEAGTMMARDSFTA